MSKDRGAADKFDILLMAVRQAIIIILGAIEDYRGMKRTKEPRRKRGVPGDDDERMLGNGD